MHSNLLLASALLGGACTQAVGDEDPIESAEASGGTTSGVSSGGETGGQSSSGGAPTGGAFAGGASTGGVSSIGGNAAGGQVDAGTGGEATGGEAAGGNATGGAGTGGSPSASLDRVIAYNLLDINPKNGRIRGHSGGGADEDLLIELGTEHGFEVDVTDDPSVFTAENLENYDVIVFASPNYAGQMISDEGRDAIESFVRGGGGWIGFHYALKVEKDWSFLRVLAGGVRVGPHQSVVNSEYTITDVSHPATADLSTTFTVRDDYLVIAGDLRDQPGVSILATADVAARPGQFSPTIWSHEVDQGRVFYSMPGHAAWSFRENWYRDLLWGALRWSAKIDE